MRAQLHVQTCEVAEPAGAARTLVTELIRDFPRQRPLSVAILAFGPHPGLTPTPWVLDGVLAALVEAERTPVQLLTLGDHETAEALLRKCGHGSGSARELIERPSRDRKISLRLASGGAQLSLPREVTGSSLLIVSPLCWVADADLASPKLSRESMFRGPVSTLLGALARAHGARPAPRGVRRMGLLPGSGRHERGSAAQQGHAWLDAGFAGSSLLIDGSWLAMLEGAQAASASRSLAASLAGGRGAQPRSQMRALAELESPARVLGLADLARLDLGTLLDCDAGLSRAIGLDTSAPAEAPSLTQAPGAWPQPQLHARPASEAAGAASRRLADRAIVGIRQAARARRSTGAALPPRVPGAFAQLWGERWYGSQALGLEREFGLRRGSTSAAGLR